MNSLSAIVVAQIAEKCAFPEDTDAPLEIRQGILVKRILTKCTCVCQKCGRQTWRPELSFSKTVSDSGIYICSHCPDNTAEARFIRDTIEKVTTQFVNRPNNTNPMTFVDELMQSGFIQQFMDDMRTWILF